MIAPGLSLPLGTYQACFRITSFPSCARPRLCGARLWLFITFLFLPCADGSSYPHPRFRGQQTIEGTTSLLCLNKIRPEAADSAPLCLAAASRCTTSGVALCSKGWGRDGSSPQDFGGFAIFFNIIVIMCFMHFDVWLIFWCLRFYCEWFELSKFSQLQNTTM